MIDVTSAGGPEALDEPGMGYLTRGLRREARGLVDQCPVVGRGRGLPLLDRWRWLANGRCLARLGPTETSDRRARSDPEAGDRASPESISPATMIGMMRVMKGSYQSSRGGPRSDGQSTRTFR